MLYNALQRPPYRVPGFHDPDDKRLMGIIFRPDTWASATVYLKPDDDNYDVVIPSVFTGLYYKVKNPGKSAATEPTWVMEAGQETEDGTLGLVWEAVNYNLMPITETISSVTYAGTHSVTVSSTSNTTTSCQFMIDVLPAAAIAAGEFEITVHVVKSNNEEVDITLAFKVDDH